MDIYKQGIGAAVTFFSILVGLALTHFLEYVQEAQPPEVDEILHKNVWLCFFIGILIFLRYLVGSSIHLYVQYIRDYWKIGTEPIRFFWGLLPVPRGIFSFYLICFF